MALRAVRLATTITLIAAAAGPSIAQRIGRDTLDPKTYTSPSGEFKLRVDPSTIYGQGEGSYRMTRGDAEVWTKKLPFTLWDAGVTDDGTVAGYAYSLGAENRPPERGDSVEGKLHQVILDPRGELRMNEILPRRGTDSCMSQIDRRVRGMIVDPENDRFIVRCREGGGLSTGETWRTYELSTGKRKDEFEFDHPRTGQHEFWLLIAARAIAGTPLILVNWEYSKYDDTGNNVHTRGGCIALVDAAGKPVWELDRPNDYPEAGDFEKTSDENREQYYAALRLEFWIREHGAILETSKPHRFDVWFVKDGQRATFQVDKDAGGTWQVTEVARAAYAGLEPEKKPDAIVRTIELKHLGTIQLETGADKPAPIRDIRRFAFDERGRIAFIRAEPATPNTFVLIEPDGTVIAEISLPGERSYGRTCNALCPVGDNRWFVAKDVARSNDPTTGLWVDLKTKTATPIESFTYALEHAVSLGGGMFVVDDEPKFNDCALVCLDEQGKVLWRVADVGHCNALASTGDGGFACATMSKEIVFYDRQGQTRRTLTVRPARPNTWNWPHGLLLDSQQNLLLQFQFDEPQLGWMNPDGTERDRFDPKYPDGRRIELFGGSGADVAFAPAGHLWAHDGHALTRLTKDGVVDRVLGAPADTPELREAGSAALDSKGLIYVSDQRNRFVHVFDTSGKRVRVYRPEPGDYPDRYGWGPITVAADGTLYLADVQFAPDGTRVGKPGWRGEFVRNSSMAWWVGEERAVLLDEARQLKRNITHRPNGNWLGQIKSHAIAPDGSLALLTWMGGEDQSDPSIHLFSPDGTPVRTLTPPEGKYASVGSEMAFNGRFVAFQFLEDVLIGDLSTEPPMWSRFFPSLPRLEWWDFFIGPSGDELWLVGKQTFRVERYALPHTVAKGS